MLLQAGNVARETRGSAAIVTPVDIMASYLFTVPPVHRRQAEASGLNAAAIGQIAKLMPGASGASDGELTGYDRAAGMVLR